MNSLASRTAAVLGFLAVALGAFGAHTLQARLLGFDTVEIWKTAALYHLVHAVAALWAAERAKVVVWLWTAGITFFSGSLYLMAAFDWGFLGPITPIGGLFLLAGWLVLVIRPR